MFEFTNRILFGGTYKVVHIARITGKRKFFWCNTWQDAIEWVSCALNDDRVSVTSKEGYMLASRGAAV